MMFQAYTSNIVALTSVTLLVACLPRAALGQSQNATNTSGQVSTTTSVAPTSGAPGGPNQATTDMQWAGMPHGVADRPWVSDLSVTTAAGVNTTLWSGLASPSVSPPSGWENVTNRFTVIIYPTNMCNVGQTPAANGCHAVPNRVQLTFACTNFQATTTDLSLCGLDNSSTIDFTLRMGSYFSNMTSWGWMNGDFSMWQQTTAADGNVSIRGRISPVTTLNVVIPTTQQCCTCDLPSNCDSNSSYGGWPAVGFFVQVSGRTPMDGCMFATTKSIMGAMAPVNIPGTNNLVASLMYRLVSAHFMPDGVTLMKGRLRALLPITTMAGLFPTSLNSSAAVAQAIASNQLSMSRNSSAQPGGLLNGTQGTSDVVSFYQWSASTNGTDALIALVDNIGFSTPSFYLGPAASLLPPMGPLGGGGGNGGGNGTRSAASRPSGLTSASATLLVASLAAMVISIW